VHSMQGFSDQVVIDAIMRALSSVGGGGNSKEIFAGLESRLAILVEGDAASLVDGMLLFLNSPAASAPPPPTSRKSHLAHLAAEGSTAATLLPPEVDVWSHPDVGMPRVLLLTEVYDGVLLILQSPSLRGSAVVQRQGSRGLIALPGISPTSLTPLLNAWAAPDGALLQVGQRIMRLQGDGSSPTTKLFELTSLRSPACSVDAVWPANGHCVIAAIHNVQLPPPKGVGGVRVWSRYQAWNAAGSRTKVRELHVFTQKAGWVCAGGVGEEACRLTLSADAQRVAWCEVDPASRPLLARVEEGAESAAGYAAQLDADRRHVPGEFWVSELSQKIEPRALTLGAGHVVSISMAPDATGVAYLATHHARSSSTAAPATGAPDQMALWWQVWEGGQPPVLLCSSTFVWVKS